jgi:oleate hydratase
MAVYEFLGIDRQIPPISPHDKSLRVQFEALIKAFK